MFRLLGRRSVFAYAGQWFCEQHHAEQQAFDGGISL
jgi:hypothetical protein